MGMDVMKKEKKEKKAGKEKDKEKEKKDKEERRREKEERKQDRAERRKARDERRKEADEKRKLIEEQIAQGIDPNAPKKDAATQAKAEPAAPSVQGHSDPAKAEASAKKWNIEPPEKKLKPWQDDELEMESEEEPTKEQEEHALEEDTLDCFMETINKDIMKTTEDKFKEVMRARPLTLAFARAAAGELQAEPRVESDEDDDDESEHEDASVVLEGKNEASVAGTSSPNKPLSKKEKRRMRREAKEKERAELAKKQFGAKGGEDGQEVMDSDPDQSEQESLEEELPSYFDLVKQFTTKKTLPAVDHSQIDYNPFRKNLYIQVKEITNMKDHEVDNLRRTHGDIKVRGKYCPRPMKNFLQCGLSHKLIKLLKRRDIETPFPIQMQAIPALMCGRDVIGIAQTGSGKTLAYLLPMIRHILDQPKIRDIRADDGPIGFIVVPTRELALQIQREAKVFCKAVGITSVCAYGGGPMGEQLSALKRGCEVLIGTPGRLIDVLTISNGKITNLRRVTFMVLDEADRMFDMGFEPQIGMFLNAARPDKQIAMFSATLPTHVETLARSVLKKPLSITVGERNVAATSVTQFAEVLDETQKFYRLLQLLGEWSEHGKIIIFVHHQHDVDQMFVELRKYGYPSLPLHGGQDQHDRDFTLQDFKDGVANILLATSVAARGIDVKDVILVINFKVPDHMEDYIHRIGRTGRAGKHGYAFTFVQPDEGDRAQDMLDALRDCGQKVPEKLQKLAEDYQSLVNTGQVVRKRKWGGFGGKSFKFNSMERSRQQKERKRAKDDALIGDDHPEAEEEEFKDPWDQDEPMNSKKKEKPQENKQEEKPKMPPPPVGADPVSTAKAAQLVAAQLQAHAAGEAAAASQAPGVPVPKLNSAIDADAAPVTATSQVSQKLRQAFTAPVLPPRRKSEEEIDAQAQKMAEETLANFPEEKKAKALPALKIKLKQKLMLAEEEAQKAALPPPAPPKAPPKPPPPTPLAKAVAAVPGVIGLPAGMAKADTLIARSIESLQANMANAKATGTVLEAQKTAQAMTAPPQINVPAGWLYDEFEINDYPEVARKRITARDPMLAIEELTGSKLWVKGQHFQDERKMPEGSKKLYVEIMGPTNIAVKRAKHEVRQMMEALAIRTLDIPGATNQKMGTPGRYDPRTGR